MCGFVDVPGAGTEVAEVGSFSTKGNVGSGSLQECVEERIVRIYVLQI